MAENYESAEKIKDYEEVSTRKLHGISSFIVKWVSIAFPLFQLYTAAFGPFPNIRQRAIHVGFAFFLCFALIPARKIEKSHNKIPIWDLICMGLAIVITCYMFRKL